MAGTKRGMPYERTGPFPLDDTFVLSKAEMLTVDDLKMPDVYFAACSDDKQFYMYDKSATPSAETGKFKVLEGGGTSYTAGNGIDATKLANGEIATKGTPIKWYEAGAGDTPGFSLVDESNSSTDWQSKVRVVGNADDVEIEFYNRLKNPNRVTKNLPTVDAVNTLVDAKQDTITGGAEGDVLVKASNTDGDFSWRHLGKDNMVYDVLWEGSATSGSLSLSRPITDYDELVFSMAYGGEHQMPKTFMSNDIVFGTTICGDNMTGSAYLWGVFDDATTYRITGAAGGATIYKITGIVFSRLDGTIGRWEKIGEWTGNQTGLQLDLSPYSAISFSPIYSNQSPRNSVVVPLSDFDEGEALISENGDTWQGEFQNKGNNTYDIRLTGASKSVLYGYKEAAISDADVQRIAEQVPSSGLPTGGTTGQVLAKKSDADGDAEWQTPVADYADLTGKPTLNGVAIEGDKADDDYELQHKLTAGYNVSIDANHQIDVIPTTVNRSEKVLWENPGTTDPTTNIVLSMPVDDFDEIYFVINQLNSLVFLYNKVVSADIVYGTTGVYNYRFENATTLSYVPPSMQLNSYIDRIMGVKYVANGGTVDDTMSDTSTNAVQNKVITSALADKVDGYYREVVEATVTVDDYDHRDAPAPSKAGIIAKGTTTNGKEVSYTFTAEDIVAIHASTAAGGFLFTLTGEGDSTAFETLQGAAGNFIYEGMGGSMLRNNQMLFVEIEVQKIDERLLPDGSTVDQSYNAYSTNAQSGTAVAEAIDDMASYTADASTATYHGVVSHGNDSLAFELDTDTVGVTMASPSVYYKSMTLPTKGYVDTEVAKKQDKLTSGTNIKTVNGNSLLGAGNLNVGVNIEVNKEKWYGTYTDENGVTYQVYSKMIYIPALPSTAGVTTYSHGISGIKQILQVYGFTADGFVLNAPRQTTADNIAIYQMSKSASNQTLSIEVGKDRSNKSAYVVMVYAKNN